MEKYLSSILKNRIEMLAKDEHSGAMDIALEAADIVREALSSLMGLDHDIVKSSGINLIKKLQNLRPSMAPLFNLMDQIGHIFEYFILQEEGSLSDFIKNMNKHILYIKEMNYKAILNAVALIKPKNKILTHSISSTIISILRLNQNRDITIYVTEARPKREGTYTARLLAQMGYYVIIITDMEAGYFMPEIDYVLVGADAILADGTVINKMGTYLIALAAQDNNKPFYVVCDNLKQLPHNEITLEEMPDKQILTNIASDKITVRNVYFDKTPKKLITAVINEEWDQVKTQ